MSGNVKIEVNYSDGTPVTEIGPAEIALVINGILSYVYVNLEDDEGAVRFIKALGISTQEAVDYIIAGGELSAW